MAATDLDFNALDLNDGTSYITSEVDDGQPWERGTVAYALARAHGMTVPDDKYVSKPIPVNGLIQGTSVADLEAKIDAFNAALSVKTGNLDIGYAGNTRRYLCIPSEFGVSRPVRGAKWAKFNILFTAVTFGMDSTLSALVNATTMKDTTTFTLNFGTASAPRQDVLITIVLNSATLSTQNTITVTNPTTGEIMTITRTFVVSDSITIDTAAQEVRVNGAIVDFGGAFPTYVAGTSQSLTISADFQTSTTVTSPGTSTWTSPAGVSHATVELWGGGGPGGATSSNGSGGGGRGGDYARKAVTVTPSTGYTLVVGGGGTDNGSVRSEGGNSTFASTVVVALGGTFGGRAALGGAAGGSTPSAGGTTTGDVTYTGGSGGSGAGSGTGGGGGGEGAGPNGNGTAGGNNSGTTGGIGGTGHAEGGDGGAGADWPGSGVATSGSAGSAPGGGGGAGARNAGGTVSGGAGAAGQARITYPSYQLTVDVDATKAYL